MRDPHYKNESQVSLDFSSRLGPYSNLSGDTPDVFESANLECFPDGLVCPPHNASVKLGKDQSKASTHKDTLKSGVFERAMEFSRDTIKSNNFYTSIGNTVLTSIFYSGLALHPLCAALAIFNRAMEFSRDTIKSNNFYTSIGNTVLTSNFYSGLALHPLCAALAIFNERRERSHESQVVTKSVDWLSQDVIDTLRSPGIYRLVLGGAFLVNMIEAHSVGNHLFAMIYGFASLGNLGAGRILNQDYWNKIADTREIEPNPKPTSANVSWANMLTNPGINWCASDLLVGAMTLHAVTTASQIAVGLSTGLAALGLGVGIYLGKRADKSPIPLLLNGCCNLGFALTHVIWGSETDVLCGIPKIAIATGAWAIASFIIAAKQHIKSQ
jgi:hypothetical protein